MQHDATAGAGVMDGYWQCGQCGMIFTDPQDGAQGSVSLNVRQDWRHLFGFNLTSIDRENGFHCKGFRASCWIQVTNIVMIPGHQMLPSIMSDDQRDQISVFCVPMTFAKGSGPILRQFGPQSGLIHHGLVMVHTGSLEFGWLPRFASRLVHAVGAAEARTDATSDFAWFCRACWRHWSGPRGHVVARNLGSEGFVVTGTSTNNGIVDKCRGHVGFAARNKPHVVVRHQLVRGWIENSDSLLILNNYHVLLHSLVGTC